MNNLPSRKNLRLKEYDYSSEGAYFITICTKNRSETLSRVGRADPGAPYMQLSEFGIIADKYIKTIETHYNDVTVDKYVIMPNHVHLLLCVTSADSSAPRSAHPTKRLSPKVTKRTVELIPLIIRVFKRLTNKEYGFDMWQTSYYDHIIRNEEDYLRIWKYTDDNPARWTEDEYYTCIANSPLG
ncbi:MAG: hypothetical protein FWC55_09805 [Firmicutes bacterium]|nr:hypothetical protein [Bacillota bacterium]